MDFETVTELFSSNTTSDNVTLLLADKAQQPDVAAASSWWVIILLLLIALLVVFVILIACFVWLNRGGKYPGESSTDAIEFSFNLHCFHGFLLVTFQFTKRSGSREGPMIRKTSWESTIASECLPVTSHQICCVCCVVHLHSCACTSMLCVMCYCASVSTVSIIMLNYRTNTNMTHIYMYLPVFFS